MTPDGRIRGERKSTIVKKTDKEGVAKMNKERALAYGRMMDAMKDFLEVEGVTAIIMVSGIDTEAEIPEDKPDVTPKKSMVGVVGDTEDLVDMVSRALRNEHQLRNVIEIADMENEIRDRKMDIIAGGQASEKFEGIVNRLQKIMRKRGGEE